MVCDKEPHVYLDRLMKWTMARPAALLALAAVAPLMVYAAFNGYVALDRRQADLTAQSVASAKILADSVDSQIDGVMEDAETLAGAPALDPVAGRPANLMVWEEVALRTRRRHHEWQAVVLMAPDGRWLYSTEPDDDALHQKVEDTGSFQAAFSTGRPTVGDVVRGGAHGKWGIPLRAPVVREGQGHLSGDGGPQPHGHPPDPEHPAAPGAVGHGGGQQPGSHRGQAARR